MNLEQAIEALLEGGQALGVSCDDVYKHIASDSDNVLAIFELVHSDEHEDARRYLVNAFRESAAHLLTESKRADDETKAGL